MNSILSKVAAFLSLLIAVPANCTTPVHAEEGQMLRVMVFNIAAGNGDLAGIAKVIRSHQPDLVGLQEVDVHWSSRSNYEDQARRLANDLGMEVFFAPIYTLPHRDEGRPVREFGLAWLSRKGFVAAVNHSLTRLSTQTQDAAPEVKPGFPEIRVKLGEKELRLFNTHLDYRGNPRIRRIQVQEMLSLIGPIEEPTILLGDLNARPDAEELQVLFATLRDAWVKENGPGYTYPSHAPDRRIDYLLVSDHIEIRRIEVIATEASDHRPLLAEIIF
jgi:endonuclease/exonuclease/phosphatase family metal-dependent hydrolase